jgi:hypothetical protein
MPTLTISYTTEAERLDLERAIAYVAEMRRVAAEAPHGAVLNTCESLALDAGRRLLRDNLEAALQSRTDRDDRDAKKKSRATAARADANAPS